MLGCHVDIIAKGEHLSVLSHGHLRERTSFTMASAASGPYFEQWYESFCFDIALSKYWMTNQNRVFCRVVNVRHYYINRALLVLNSAANATRRRLEETHTVHIVDNPRTVLICEISSFI